MQKPIEDALLEIIKIVNCQEEKNSFDLESIKPYLDDHMRVRVIPKEGYIVKEGDVVKYVYFVITGEFFMMRLSETGKNNVLKRKVAPQFIGIDRILNDQMPSSASNMVIRKCIVLEIELSYFVDSIRKSGELGLLILKNTVEKLTEASYRADRLLFQDSRTRLLYYICEHWDKHHKGKGVCVIEVSNTYIADDIGISTRTLYRVLNELKAEGLVSTKGGNMVITYDQMMKMRECCSDSLSKIEG